MAGQLNPQWGTTFNPKDPNQWRWEVGKTQSPSEGVITGSDSTVTMVGILYAPEKLYHAQAFFLGYSWVDDKLKLRRRLPAFAPESPWLFCTRFTWQGMKYLGDQSYEYEESPNALPYPGFKYYRCKVQFGALPYEVKSDAALSSGSEQDRFVSVEPQDDVQWIALDGGQYVYRAPGKPFDTPAGSDLAKNIIPSIVKGPTVRVKANRTGFLVTWWDVAESYVCDRFSDPVALCKAKGTINSTTFMNRPRGTMLLDTFRVSKRPSPIATETWEELLYTLKIEMFYKFTNPTPALTEESGASTPETERGWQLLPGPDSTSAEDWYYVWNYNASTDHLDQSKGLYTYYDHNLIFEHHSKANLGPGEF